MPKFRAFLNSNLKIKTKLLEAETPADAISQASLILSSSDIMIVEERTLTCPKCGYVWKFSGHRKYYATCAQCMRQIKLYSGATPVKV
jgi:hypothetical protein